MQGYIDSIETMGLVDGPGIRMVVFLKGCKLRCLYCHNPETWDYVHAKIMTSDEIVEKVKNNMSYYKNGGITFSGGEPLLQADFLIDCLKKCKELGIHTALDTAGYGIGKYDEILKYTDLVILDIKALTDEGAIHMTGRDLSESNKFMEAVKRNNTPLWIRQVVVSGINDNIEYMKSLKEYLKQFNTIEKIELLPYHLYGVEKYKRLNIPYRLEGVEPLTDEDMEPFMAILKD